MNIKMNARMAWLLSGKWAGHMCATIGKCLLEETLGPGKMASRHLSQRQGKWPQLAPSTKRDNRKKDGRIFVRTGKAEKALRKNPKEGKLRAWTVGKNKPVTRKRYRYTAQGMWSTAEVTPGGLLLAVGFAGRLTHSKQVLSARQTIAVQRGVKLKGLSRKAREKAIRAAVTVDEAVQMVKKAGGGRKWAGAKAKTNLAYASVLQLGVFAGVKNKKGKVFSAQEAARGLKKKDVKGGYSVLRGGKQRPLLPYDGADNGVIQRAVQRGVAITFKEIG